MRWHPIASILASNEERFLLYGLTGTSVRCRVHLARARCVPFVIEPPVWRHMPRFAKTDKIVWRKQKLPFPERGAIAQLGERIVRNDEVVGSSPTSSTMFSATCGPCCRFPSPFVLLFVS